MKKYLFSIIFTAGIIFNTNLAHAEEDPCTRPWAKSVSYITQRHEQDQASCAIGGLINWLGGATIGNALQAIYAADCAEQARNDFSSSLDLAAEQYGACVSML